MVLNLLLLYFFAALVSGKIGVLIRFFAVFPFFIPVITQTDNEPSKKLITKSFLYGICGTLCASIFAGVSGVLSVATIVIYSLLAFLLSTVMFVLHNRIKPSKFVLIKVICIMAAFLLCN